MVIVPANGIAVSSHKMDVTEKLDTGFGAKEITDSVSCLHPVEAISKEYLTVRSLYRLATITLLASSTPVPSPTSTNPVYPLTASLFMPLKLLMVNSPSDPGDTRGEPSRFTIWS